ncbi:hypothetical protein [Thermoanaerobacterium sp. DL9XJH110]|uniref:hypothetical protein n=1 Tax=Thermoanaerobacterium sp. DL9XJH110 TaxID=3386643 RepID=UPI003BB52DE4
MEVIIPEFNQKFEITGDKVRSIAPELKTVSVELLYNRIKNELDEMYKTAVRLRNFKNLYDKLKEVEKVLK